MSDSKHTQQLRSNVQNWAINLQNAFAGAAAGAVTAFATNPLDVARTRTQVQYLVKGQTPKYHGLRQTLGMMWKEEGFRCLFKGLLPQLLGLIPSWAIYFSVYDHLKPFLSKKLGDKWNPSAVHLTSAVCAGAVTNLGTTPFFTVKTRLQTQLVNTDPNGKSTPQYRNMFDAFKKITKTEGWLVLWSGLMPSMIGLVHVAIQFPLYEKFKTTFANTKPDPKEQLNIMELFLCAAGSKVVASAAAYPHEVVRSRLQGQGHGLSENGVRYSGVIDAVGKIWRQEGIRAFYQGLGITLCRTVPASMITLTVYEEALRFIRYLTAS